MTSGLPNSNSSGFVPPTRATLLANLTAPAARRSPAIFVPEGYEHSYAYPLIVWLLGPRKSRLDLLRVMTQVSTRNYLGVAFRSTEEEWAELANGRPAHDTLSTMSERLLKTVREVRSSFHMHTERVFLGGFDRSANLALELGLHHPEWFAGIALFGADWSRLPVERCEDFRGKRVLLAMGSRDDVSKLHEMQGVSRQLATLGSRVDAQVFDAAHEVTRPMLVELDRWAMGEVCQEV